MKSHISADKGSPAVEPQASENFGGTHMSLRNFVPLATETLRRTGASMRRRLATTAANWTCAILYILLCSAAAQAQSNITGFLVNGVSATSGPVGATLTIQGSGFGSTQGFSTATL